MSLNKTITLTVLIVVAGLQSTFSATPNTINYQGRLTDATGAPVSNGAYTVRFFIYDAPVAGTELWQSGSQTVNTLNGLFSYELGSNEVFPNTLFADTSRWLGIIVGTDPEIAPRTKITSQAFARQALNSDTAQFASNANLLSGKSSSDFVATAGDVMTGALGFSDASTPMTYIYQSGTANRSHMIAAHSPFFPQWGIAYNDSLDEIHFQSPTGLFGSVVTTVAIGLSGSGDNSVRVPDDAISAAEILDEPGIAQGRNASVITLNNSTMQDLTTITITIPNSGYIYLQGHTSLYFAGAFTGNSAVIQIDETAGGGSISGIYTTVGAATLDGGFRYFSASTQRTYFKNAGTYTFRLEASNFTGLTPIDAERPILTAIYLPSSYGTVTTVSPSPDGDPEAKTVEVTDRLDDSPTTVYEVDLRTLEIKARRAREAALRAELELRNAQRQAAAKR